MRIPILILLILSSISVLGQSSVFENIEDTPEEYGASQMVARMVEGLGFRYYWATEGLRPEDLEYRPNADARSTEETLQHLYNLSEMIFCAARKVTVSRTDAKTKSFEALRKETLENLELARELFLNSTEVQAHQLKMGQVDFPVWNLINGPLADAIYHTGQIVSFRRSSGNPIDSRVNVFIGRTNR
jgi:hypothetical protein